MPTVGTDFVMIDEPELPSLAPTRHELAAIADEIVADIQHHCGTLSEESARLLRHGIIARLLYVRDAVGR